MEKKEPTPAEEKRELELAAAAQIYLLHHEHVRTGRPAATGVTSIDRMKSRELAVQYAAYVEDCLRLERLNELMPGWKYVNAEDCLQKDEIGVFISNKREEWRAWLLSKGVKEFDVERLIRETFDEIPF